MRPGTRVQGRHSGRTGTVTSEPFTPGPDKPDDRAMCMVQWDKGRRPEALYIHVLRKIKSES